MKLKKKLLTAAICLALSTGHALAMPAGGQIVTGDNISGFVPNPESGATITFGGNGVINWDAFNIGANESLTFDVVKNALAFNYVSGADISTILGHLTQSGEGGMLLCNPNGIMVGNGAVINANDFTMMTMKLTDDQLKNVFKAGGSDILMTAGKDKAGNPALIDIQSGANFKITDKINLYGGRIAIADGVVISSEPDTQNGGIKNDDIHIFAGNEMQIENGEGGPDLVGLKATKDNSVTIGAVDLTANKNVGIQGGSISLNGTKITSGDIDLHAQGSIVQTGADTDPVYTSSVDNKVTLDKAHLATQFVDQYNQYAGGEISITGGDVDIANSKLITSNQEQIKAGHIYVAACSDKGALDVANSTINSGKGDISLFAIKEYADRHDDNYHTPNNNVAISGTRVTAAGRVDVHGSNVSISDKSSIKGKYGSVWAGEADNPIWYGADFYRDIFTANASNKLTVDKSQLEFSSGYNKLSLRGGTVNISDSTIENNGAIFVKAYDAGNKGSVTVSNSNISVTGGDKSNEDMAVWSQGNIVIKNSQLNSNGYASVIATENLDNYLTYGADNKIAISGSSITAPGKMRIYGSSIDIMNGSAVEAGNDLSIEAKAEEIKGGTADNIEYVTKANADNILNVTADSKIKSHGVGGGTLDVIAGRATIAGHLYNTKTEEEPFEYDKAVGTITILADSSSVPDPEPVLPEIPDVPVAPIEGLDEITEDTPMDKVAEVIQKQVNTLDQADKAISQVVKLNISNEKKAEVVRTIIENVEVSAEADTHVQNMSAAVQNEDSVATVSAETASVGNETAGADMSADVTVDGTDVQE